MFFGAGDLILDGERTELVGRAWALDGGDLNHAFR
jgi:hypothetical protein